MKKTGKILTTFVLVFTLLWSLASCGANDVITPDNWDLDEETSTKPVTLKFTHIWPEHDETFDIICDDFTRKYPNVTIQKNVKNYSNIATSLSTSWGSSQFPDVSYYWTHSMTSLVNGEAQMAADLTDIYYEVHKDEFINDGDCFVSGKINGKYYNVPFRATGFVIYYNKTLFDTLGLSVPKNLEEFETLLAEIREKTDLTPLACWGAAGTYSYIGQTLNVYYEILSGKASDPNYRTDRLTLSDTDIDNQAYICEKVRRWTNKGYFGSNPLAGGTESVERMFLNDQCAMAMLNNNSLEVIQAEMESEVGCFSLPGFSLMENPTAGYVSGGYDGFFISNASKNKAWALRFLEYLNSAEVQQLFADNEGSIMSRKNIEYADDLQQQIADCMASVGIYGAFPDYSLSTAASSSSLSVNQYTVNKNGSFTDCRALLQAAYNSKVNSVTDSMLNPQGLSMLQPTYTVDTEKRDAYMAWIRSDE